MIVRHFVTVRGRWGTRQVHYRRAGHGPLVLLLHQSPQSSREYEPLMAEWAGDFTVVAPDSPGYGLSDPLGTERASLDDFADATIEFLDAIGAGRTGVYGYHTGGMIGIALGHRHPDRITAVACNGVAILTAAEREEILRDYLPPLVPRWDGGHLAWLWARLREQAIFFPWHVASRETRISFAVPPPAVLQTALLEFLRADRHYHVAYRAAFEYRADEVLGQTTTPTLATAVARDPIRSHLERIPAPAPPVRIAPAEDTPAALALCHEHLAGQPGDPLPPAPAPESVPDRLWCDLVPAGAGPIRVYRGGTGEGVPALVLHGAGRSAASVLPVAAELARSRPVIAPDLPGHGESPGIAPRLTDLDAWLLGICGSLGLRRVHLVAVEGAGALAAAMALSPRSAALVDRVVFLNPEFPGGDEVTVARAGIDRDGIDWYGGHLLRAWHTVRDGRLFWPWCHRVPAGVRQDGPRLDPADIHRDVTELLKAGDCWQSLMEDQLTWPLATRLATPSLAGRVLLGVVPGAPGEHAAGALASRAGLPLVTLAPEPAAWGRSAAGFLAG